MTTHSRRPTPEQIADELDGLIETRDVERATGYTRRWIAELISRGRFPPPDVRGRRGSAHRWRRSTIRHYLQFHLAMIVNLATTRVADRRNHYAHAANFVTRDPIPVGQSVLFCVNFCPGQMS